MLPLYPFTCSKCAEGTISGIMAFTVGICIPAPKERILKATNNNEICWYPAKNKRARMRVAIAIIESLAIINSFFTIFVRPNSCKRRNEKSRKKATNDR